MQVRNIKWIVLFNTLSILFLCMAGYSQLQAKVRTGLDRVNEYPHLFEGKRTGIVTNHSAVNKTGKHITDIFLAMENVEVIALFGPEHGVFGNEAAGQKIESNKKEEIPVFSLYGKTLKPTKEMLQNVDLLVFDIQDIGARYYTYIWTLSYVMDAAAENGIPLVVLDRPNPLSGNLLEGNTADTSSFVGRFPIPVRHGMTVGELAKMFIGERWTVADLDLTIISLENWTREMWFDQTGLSFIAPSPNMPDLETATIYPGMCLLEGTNLSEGRGTNMPFKIFGAPWFDSKRHMKYLQSIKLKGVTFKDTTFTPVTIAGKAVHPKFENEVCNGIKITVENREAFNSYETGVQIIQALYKLYPQNFQFKQRHFDRLAGTSKIRRAILDGATDLELTALLSKGLKEFKQKRKTYLIY